MAIEWIMRVLRAPLVATTVSLAACGTLLDPLKAPGPSKPGEIALEPSTPHSLGFRWPVAGDGNGNARVDVAYRRAGSAEWLEAYPLFRVNPDFISRDNQVSGGVLYAGSIVDLAPDTPYEVRLTLTDPDGGAETRTLSARTAREPVAPPGLRLRHVVPGQEGAKPGSGTRSDPFAGLAAALAGAEPGDVLSLAPGTYRGAPIKIARSGTEQLPIVIRGPVQGEAILDGDGALTLFDASGAHDLWFEKLTLRNARTLIRADLANRLVVRHNRFDLKQFGVRAQGATYTESRGFFITDNIFDGTTKWPPLRSSEPQNRELVIPVIVTGSGHVVAYNSMRNVDDGIHNDEIGRLSASDIHNNDIEIATDDAIEADYVDTNVRVYRNRVTNALVGVSADPCYGGPLYIFRNLILNTELTPFKLGSDTSGVVLFHNTSVREGTALSIQPGEEAVTDVISRNNVYIGAGGPALATTRRMFHSDFDADGYAWRGKRFADWGGVLFLSPAEAQKDGEIYRKHGAATLDPGRLFASGLLPPEYPDDAFPAAANDLRLRADSGAVDRGVPLANFSDRYAGSAPDLGCCELGAPLPHFGPRPQQ